MNIKISIKLVITLDSNFSRSTKLKITLDSNFVGSTNSFLKSIRNLGKTFHNHTMGVPWKGPQGIEE